MGVVGAAAQNQAGRMAQQRQRQKHSLQHEPSGPGRADRPFVITRAQLARRKSQRQRTQLIALHRRCTNFDSGAYAGQMLAQQTRLRPPATDINNPERAASDYGQRESRPQHLAAAPTLASVDFDHTPTPSLRLAHGATGGV